MCSNLNYTVFSFLINKHLNTATPTMLNLPKIRVRVRVTLHTFTKLRLSLFSVSGNINIRNLSFLHKSMKFQGSFVS